jgi:hypothetical protein
MTTLSAYEQRGILSDFPKNVKLSYENIIHKKVYSDFVLAIPHGKRCFAWFSRKGFYVLQIGENKEVVEVKAFKCCFSNDLKQGTLFYGTLFLVESKSVFCIEDVMQYKGEDVFKQLWQEKLEIFRQVMKFDIKQISYDDTYLLFGLPVMRSSFEELIKEINTIVHYRVKCVQFRKLDNKNVSQCLAVKNDDGKYTICGLSSTNPIPNPNPVRTKRDVVFKVRPTIQPDIYHLYDKDTSKYVDIAFITDFKTSVMMNKLFRNIKENDNLDALEDSDDEEEFENTNVDRFVFLDREYEMTCSYNQKFKKWMPYKLHV